MSTHFAIWTILYYTKMCETLRDLLKYEIYRQIGNLSCLNIWQHESVWCFIIW